MSDSIDDDQTHRPINAPSHPGETDTEAELTMFDFIDSDLSDVVVFDLLAGIDLDGEPITLLTSGDDILCGPEDELAG